jgi:hypothetical protein
MMTPGGLLPQNNGLLLMNISMTDLMLSKLVNELSNESVDDETL